MTRLETLSHFAFNDSRDRENYFSRFESSGESPENLAGKIDLCENDIILCANRIIEQLTEDL